MLEEARAGQDRSGQSKAGQGRAGQHKARAGLGMAGLHSNSRQMEPAKQKKLLRLTAIASALHKWYARHTLVSSDAMQDISYLEDMVVSGSLLG